MEFSKAGLTPASQATFGQSYGKKQKKIKTLKNDLRVMKQILYDMGKKNIIFLITYSQFLTNTFVRDEVGRGVHNWWKNKLG